MQFRTPCLAKQTDVFAFVKRGSQVQFLSAALRDTGFLAGVLVFGRRRRIRPVLFRTSKAPPAVCRLAIHDLTFSPSPGECRSGQTGQTVNLLAKAYGG